MTNSSDGAGGLLGPRHEEEVANGCVLLVANYESDVGYAWWLMENFWQLISVTLAGKGRHCLLVYPRLGHVPAVVQESPAEVIEFRFGVRSWSEIWRGLQLIRRRHVNSVYLTDWPHLHWVYLLWRLAGVRRIVIHEHTPGDRPPLTGLRGWFKAALHAPGVLSASLYVAVSEYIGYRLRSNSRVPARRCVVVENGVRLFDCLSARRPEIRQRLGVPEDALLVVLVSRATYYKGLDFSIRCLALLLQDHSLRPRVHAVHCGDGPDLEDFKSLARLCGVDSNYHFLGRRQDIRDILCASDVAFHPSHGEAMSLAILEFMCAGLAILTSDLPSVCTPLDVGVTGLTYEHNNVNSAVDKLRTLVDDSQLRRSLGSTAASACRTKYALEKTNRLFLERVVSDL